MHKSLFSIPAVCVTIMAALCASHEASGFGGNNGTICPQPGGPDLIIGDITVTPANYTAEQWPGGSGNWYDAFSFGRTLCNIGDQNLNVFYFPSTQHPAFTQSMFKLKDGRFEQVAMSWVCHQFTVLSGNICGCGCNNPGSGAFLGAGCSDPKPASTVGNQPALTPRWEVNPYTGSFPSPPSNPPFEGPTARRLRGKSAEFEPSSPAVQYFTEFIAVSAHDSSVGNQFNNASYREITITGGPNEFNAAVTGSTKREQAAIRAWKANDPAVLETVVLIPGDGQLILAARATDLGNGTWHYEYAMQNINSDISARSFIVPLALGTTITNIGFHDVDYHGGDGIPLPDGPDPDTDPDWRNFDPNDWKATPTSESITWSTDTFAENPNANALRWATLYNFRFDADRPPAFSQVTIGTFKAPGSVNAPTIVPSPAVCIADIAGGDGQVNIDDLLTIINAWGSNGGPADINQDGTVGIDDLLAVINGWGPCS